MSSARICYLGRCHTPSCPIEIARQGTRFRVRITDPTDYAAVHFDDSPLDQMVELVINDTYAIRFARRSPSPIRHYTATCTRAFWPGCDPENLTELLVAEFDLDDAGSPVNFRSPSGETTFNLQEWFCCAAIARIRELLAVALRGVSWIGAIRSVEGRADVEEKVFEDRNIAEDRYVGSRGEYAQALARRFAYNEMRLLGNQGHASINYEFSKAGSGVIIQLLMAQQFANACPPLLRRIWESASEESKQEIGRFFEDFENEDTEDENIEESVAHLRTVRLLNEVLRRRDLYDPDVWPELDPESSALVRKGVSSLTEDEVTKRNRKLIESAFPNSFRPHPGLVFETFYASWLKRLLDTRLFESESATNSSADDWSGDQPPCGFLLRYTPDEERASAYERSGHFLEHPSGEITFLPDKSKLIRRDLGRLASRPLQGTQFRATPLHMSSGFHQVAPIIVQAGLMAANEILCVENPEVHLHPKLQLEMTEFLV